MKHLRTILSVAALLLVAFQAQAQITTTQTTFSSAVTTTTATQVTLTSGTGVVVPTAGANGSFIYVDTEAMQIRSLVSGTTYNVQRGVLGTKPGTHNTVSIVYVGNVASGSGDSSRPFTGVFPNSDPALGSCTPSAQAYLPVVVPATGRVWTCPSSGPQTNIWSLIGGAMNVVQTTDNIMFVPYSACVGTTTGTLAGSGQGAQLAGSTAVTQISTTNAAGAATHTYTCTVPVPTRTRSNDGIAIQDITFLYGVQTSALGTQANVLASGTFNGSTVFGRVTYPTPAASQTASTVTPVRADSGTMVITPVVASFNTGTTTAGAFFSARFAPATPFLVNTDNQQLIFTVTFLCTTTVATITNTPGFVVHYTNVPL